MGFGAIAYEANTGNNHYSPRQGNIPAWLQPTFLIYQAESPVIILGCFPAFPE